jgi:D-proline reductase (dithiol) PrdB
MNNLSKHFKALFASGVRVLTTIDKPEKINDAIKSKEQVIPWTALSKPISSSRFAIVSTAGVHLLSQEQFNRDDDGDPSYREIYSSDMSPENVMVNSCVEPSLSGNGIESVLPVKTLNKLASSGEIGYANYRHFSFFGHVRGNKLAALMHQYLPKVINYLKSDEVDIVILTSNCKRCDHTMRIIQRAIETAGFVSISITNYKTNEQNIAVPRAIYVEPASVILAQNSFEDRVFFKAVIGEVLHHLAFTDKPGLQSDIMNPKKCHSEGRKKNHSEKNRHRSSDFVYESFGHSYNKGEEFAWGAFVKYW